MSLLHGDLNALNVLTPKTSERPVYFLDRQPFDWSLTYGVAAYDLAYFLVWWPTEVRTTHEASILRRWHASIQQEDYSWEQTRADWKLCVEQCLHIPLEWCAEPQTATKMRWLWERQLTRIRAALVMPTKLEGTIVDP
jgi:hypothetical protein